MKYLLVLLVVVIGLYVLMGRARRPRPPDAPPDRAPQPAPSSAAKSAAPTPMLACAHCGVHLPSHEAALDAAGRGYCGEAHRLAGPR